MLRRSRPGSPLLRVATVRTAQRVRTLPRIAQTALVVPPSPPLIIRTAVIAPIATVGAGTVLPRERRAKGSRRERLLDRPGRRNQADRLAARKHRRRSHLDHPSVRRPCTTTIAQIHRSAATGVVAVREANLVAKLEADGIESN